MHFLLFKQIESLLNLVTELLAISKAERDAQESVINRQTALYSLKLLSRLLAKDHPNQFKDVSNCSYCSTFCINSTLVVRLFHLWFVWFVGTRYFNICLFSSISIYR